MATVGSVIAALQGLDPDLPVGALRIERHGEITTFHLNDVVEVHVTHQTVSGEPLAAWVVTGLPTADTPEVLRQALPAAWTVTRDRCGCVLPLRVRLERQISTLAARCPHREPSEQALRIAERYPGD